MSYMRFEVTLDYLLNFNHRMIFNHTNVHAELLRFIKRSPCFEVKGCANTFLVLHVWKYRNLGSRLMVRWDFLVMHTIRVNERGLNTRKTRFSGCQGNLWQWIGEILDLVVRLWRLIYQENLVASSSMFRLGLREIFHQDPESNKSTQKLKRK